MLERIGSGLLLLLTHPAELARLQSEPGLMDDAFAVLHDAAYAGRFSSRADTAIGVGVMAGPPD